MNASETTVKALSGQRALVTGANSGIGAAVARSMAAAGARVVINIAPGAIKTPINKSAWDSTDAERELLKLIPYGRVGDPDDVGKVAVWLASDAADYLTGVTLYVDGGMMLYPGFRTGG